MATRTNDLTEVAKPVADEMAARTGTLKQLLSAGVLAFANLTPAMREYYMALAVGKEIPKPTDEDPSARVRATVLRTEHRAKHVGKKGRGA